MNVKFSPTIGLEIHAELKTKTKLFCNSLNNPNEKEPNKNICAICMGQPGTLPCINKEAIKHILKIGLAVEGQLADYSEFDRKNYFYPDIPKGYQISQYKYPLVSGGELCDVMITRVHLEEDTAKSSHEDNKFSFVDFNRAGIPLMELVTEPVIKSTEEAVNFAKELQILLQYLDVGEANMDKGEMRVEANISVSKDNSLGTKVEVKNLNSFKSVEKAINFEIKRHIKLLEKGESIIQETRGWDEVNEKTYSQRIKEESHDYRYFPDPDLPKLYISEIPEFSKDILIKELPELPWKKRNRLSALGFLQNQDVEQLIGDSELASLFGEAEQILVDPAMVKIAANFILNDIVGQHRKDPNWSLPDAPFLTEVVRHYHSGTMSSPQAKKAILSKRMLAVLDNKELPTVVKKVIENNPKIVTEYRDGKESVLQFLIGEGMKESKGSANPKVLSELFVSELNKS